MTKYSIISVWFVLWYDKWQTAARLPVFECVVKSHLDFLLLDPTIRAWIIWRVSHVPNTIFKFDTCRLLRFRWLNTIALLQPVVVSKHFNKGGSKHNHAHSLGVAQLEPRPCFQRWKHDNLVQYWCGIINNKKCLNSHIAVHNWS